ncbi:uncharacterized protein [Nicotiana sylvestris]|uniref:uncharacterized protein n=1 Tax=Nicotiana sylvestris TaxID=4096 RepID=UPI00388C95B0
MAPGYLTWYRRELEHERPTKRPHIRSFTESSQKQWDWLEKERAYRAEIGRLKQQVEGLKYEHNMQVAAGLGEKNRLTQENETLSAQIKQMKIDANNQPRSRSDERLIKALRTEIGESQNESENTIAGLEVHWARRTEKRNRHLRQLEKDHERTMANLKGKVDRAFEQIRTLGVENKHCRKLLAQMEVEIQQWQNRCIQDSRVMTARNDQIECLLREKRQTRDKIRTIAHAIIRRCLRCENMTNITALSAMMVYVKQTMHELEQLERDLTPRTATRPNNAPQAPVFKTLMYS